MAVHPGAEIRGGHFRAAGLVAAGFGSMGALSGRTTGQRQSPRVHEFHRAAPRGWRGCPKGELSEGPGARLTRNESLGGMTGRMREARRTAPLGPGCSLIGILKSSILETDALAGVTVLFGVSS